MVVCAFRKTKQCQKVKKEERWLFFFFLFNIQARFSKKPAIIFSPCHTQRVSWEKSFEKKTETVFMLCKSNPTGFYPTGAFMFQKEKEKTLVEAKVCWKFEPSLFDSETKPVPIPPGFLHISGHAFTFFHFVGLTRSLSVDFLFLCFFSLANFQHLATKNKSSTNYTKELDFKGKKL